MTHCPKFHDIVFELNPSGGWRECGRVTKVIGRVCYYADPSRGVFSTFIWRFGNKPNQRFRWEPGGSVPAARQLTVLNPRDGSVFLQKRLPDGFAKLNKATMNDFFPPGPERDSLAPDTVHVLNMAISCGDWYVTAHPAYDQGTKAPRHLPAPATQSGKKSYRTRTGMHVFGSRSVSPRVP